MGEAVRVELEVGPTTIAAPGGAALVGYIEDMLLELAHMASAGGEAALAASLGIAAIQAGARLRGISA